MDNKKMALQWKGEIKLDSRESLHAEIYDGTDLKQTQTWQWYPPLSIIHYLGEIVGEYEVRLIHNTCFRPLIEDKGSIKDLLDKDSITKFSGAEDYSARTLANVIRLACPNPATVLKEIKVEWDMLEDRQVYVSKLLEDIPKWKLRRIAARKAKKLAELMADNV